MSRNFELLSQVGGMQDLLQSPGEFVPTAVETPMPAPSSESEQADGPPGPLLNISGAARDQIGRLVQNLFLGPQDYRTVVFSGTEPGCGSTWTCGHAADLLAETHRKVCVLDCNLRSPGLHTQFNKENNQGLCDALRGPGPIREYVQRLSRNLWLLSCGSISEAGSTMLGSERMRGRLAELRNSFDYLLIDVAPMNVSNDALVLGALTDGVVLVLKAHSSRRENARNAVQSLEAASVRTLGAVLNQRTFPIPEKLYKRL